MASPSPFVACSALVPSPFVFCWKKSKKKKSFQILNSKILWKKSLNRLILKIVSISQNAWRLPYHCLEFQKFFSITRTIFLTVGQNNFGNKITYSSKRKPNENAGEIRKKILIGTKCPFPDFRAEHKRSLAKPSQIYFSSSQLGLNSSLVDSKKVPIFTTFQIEKCLRWGR